MQERDSNSSALLYRGDDKELAIAAADHLMEVLEEFADEEYIVLGCCGGNSPIALYECLAQELSKKGDEVLGKLQVFFVDERVVTQFQIDSGEAQSMLNSTTVREALIDPLLQHGVFTEEQFHKFPQDNTEDIKQRVQSYYAKLREYGGRFNAVVLGVGYDGHVAGAFPFPHITSEDEETQGFVSYVGAPKPPPKRITATIGLLAASDFGLVMFQGEKKQEALESFAKTDSTREIPACVVKRMARHLVATNIDCEATKALLA